jgi:hypothetical protein
MDDSILRIHLDKLYRGIFGLSVEEFEQTEKNNPELINKYFKAMRDMSSRLAMIKTGRATHEDEHKEHEPSKEQIEVDMQRFAERYDEDNIKDLKDLQVRMKGKSPDVEKYKKRLAYLNKWAESYGLTKITDQV